MPSAHQPPLTLRASISLVSRRMADLRKTDDLRIGSMQTNPGEPAPRSSVSTRRCETVFGQIEGCTFCGTTSTTSQVLARSSLSGLKRLKPKLPQVSSRRIWTFRMVDRSHHGSNKQFTSEIRVAVSCAAQPTNCISTMIFRFQGAEQVSCRRTFESCAPDTILRRPIGSNEEPGLKGSLGWGDCKPGSPVLEVRSP